MNLTQRQAEKLKALKYNTTYFAKHCLKIKTKEGKVQPFQVNSAQIYLHNELERIKRETGKVRALVVKGRQMGITTYTQARFFQKTALKRGTNTFILSHEAKSTANIFNMVKKYYDYMPESIKPKIKTSNAKILEFDELDSIYQIGTAGKGDVGRSMSNKLFHGSEVAFWDNTDDLQTGVMQTVSDMEGTEIILESTANGMQGFFYDQVQESLLGDYKYKTIFIPWYWMDEYREPVIKDFEVREEEEELVRLYGLDHEQLQWRRGKIREFRSEWKFKQEYPNILMEAFQTSGTSLIPPEVVLSARQSNITDSNAPLVMGVDPARSGDRTCICFRRGREIPAYYVYNDMNEMKLAGIVAKYIKQHSPVKCFIDVGLGYGTIDRLHELGYSSTVEGIHFGESAIERDIYLNKRAEMWCELRDWFYDDRGVSIPDKEDIVADLAMMPDFVETSTKIKLIEKAQIKKDNGGKSPDIGDAMALTFAQPVFHSNKLEISKGKNISKGLKRRIIQ